MQLTQKEVDFFFQERLAGYRFQDMDKAKRICELRLKGFTYQAIGEQVGLSKDRVREYVVKVKKVYARHLYAYGRRKKKD